MSKNNQKILEVKNLNKVFSNKGALLKAVDNANFTLKKGETVGLIGESGSGKTTIGRTIIRLHNPTSGQVLINGVDVGSKKISKQEEFTLRNNVQMIFQDPYSSLNEQKNIMNIVSEPLKVLKLDEKLVTNLFEYKTLVQRFFEFNLRNYYERTTLNNMLELVRYKNTVYQNVIDNMENFTFDRPSIKKDVEALIAMYYGERIDANQIIVDKNLLVTQKLFKHWEGLQKRIENKKLEDRTEEAVLKAMVAQKKAESIAKDGKKKHDLILELETCKYITEEFKVFEANLLKRYKRNIANLAHVYKTESELIKQKKQSTKSVSEWNNNHVLGLLPIYFRRKVKSLKNEYYIDDLSTRISEMYEKSTKVLIKSLGVREKLSTWDSTYYNYLNIQEYSPEVFQYLKDNFAELHKLDGKKITFESFKIYLKANKISSLKKKRDADGTLFDEEYKLDIRKMSRDEFERGVDEISLKLESLGNVKASITEERNLKLANSKLREARKKNQKAKKEFAAKFLPKLNQFIETTKQKINEQEEALKLKVDKAKELFEAKLEMIYAQNSAVENAELIKNKIKDNDKTINEYTENLKKNTTTLDLKVELPKAFVKQVNDIKSYIEGLKAENIELKKVIKTDKVKNKIISQMNVNINSIKQLKKWVKKTIAKNDDMNSAFDNEGKRVLKDIRLIKSFLSGHAKKEDVKHLLVRDRVYKALEESGLTKAHAYRYPHEFSGGMRQRVGIARAIISDPNIIIADEPIAALDLSIQAQIANMLREVQKKRGMSMIFIAHDLSMVKHISDKIVIIHLGKIVEKGTTKEIFGNPIHPYTKNLIASMPDIKNISKGFAGQQFEADYLKDYTVVNTPKYIKVKGTHQVLATKEQFKEWVK